MVLAIVGAQARFDMRERDAKRVRGQCPAEGAGRIALYDQQLRAVEQMIGKACGHQSGMRPRLFESPATQAGSVEAPQSVVNGIERWVLPGEDEPRIDAAVLQRVGDGSELDGFGAGADDQPHVGRTQSSP